MMDAATDRPVGEHLRTWRQRRRLSQLDLALDADISARHLSFVENGRARPSRDMVLRLAEELDVPLRERNVLLVSAGYAPTFPEHPFGDPLPGEGMRIVDTLLTAHSPFPALAVDRHWTLVAANAPAGRLMAGVRADLLVPPVNVLRLSLHPGGLAPSIVNLSEWRAHVFERLRRQIDASADPVLVRLLDELQALPGGDAPPGAAEARHAIAVPFRLATASGVLDFITTTTIFGTPVDVTLSEVAVETFFPADAATAAVLLRMAAG